MAKQPTLRTIKTGEVFTVVNEHGIETDSFWGPDGHLYIAKGGLGSGRTTYTRKSKNLPFKLKKKSNPKRQSSSLNPPYYIYYADSYKSKKPTITEAKRYVRQAVSNVHPIEGFSIRDGDDKLIIDYETGKDRKHNPIRKKSNPSSLIGKWIPAQAVKVNANGTVNIKRTKR